MRLNFIESLDIAFHSPYKLMYSVITTWAGGAKYNIIWLKEPLVAADAKQRLKNKATLA